MEAHAERGRDRLLRYLEDPVAWGRSLAAEVILPRLMQRYLLAGGRRNQLAASRLFELAPDDTHAKRLLIGAEEGLRGQDLALLPEALSGQLRRHQEKFSRGKLTPALRRNERAAVAQGLEVIADVRAAALRLFTSRAAWAESFLTLVADKQAIKREEVPLDIVRAFKLLGDSTVNQIVDATWPAAVSASTADKAAAVDRIKRALAGGSGDLAAGAAVYAGACGTCHKVGDRGGHVGPDLTGYDRSNLNYLVLNIVDPNADIREGYVNYLLERTDGQALFGTLVDRSDALVTLRAQDGVETTVPTAEIASLEALPTSLMPERIIDGLSDEEIRDLFTYLQQAVIQ